MRTDCNKHVIMCFVEEIQTSNRLMTGELARGDSSSPQHVANQKVGAASQEAAVLPTESWEPQQAKN